MGYNVVRVNKDNYFMFYDMVFYRKHGREKNKNELSMIQDFSSYYTALEIQTFYAFAVQFEEKFVGYIFINFFPKVGTGNGKGWLYVDDLWVNPNFRRKGVANTLMEKADALSKEMGTLGLRLYVNTNNPDGISLYKKCGYEQKFGTALMMQKEWIEEEDYAETD